MNPGTSTTKRPKIRVFNPHRLKANELEESFIARQDLFRSILSDVAAGQATSAPQHHLVIGQRGMGKTTLLRRLALELHREPYGQRFLPLNFAEDQHIEVDRLSKFWLNCLDSMADALEHEGQDGAAQQIDEVVNGLSQRKTDETTYQEECRDAFSAAWKPLGRRPVLFVDNFNLLLARLRTEDFALRGYFSASGAPVLVAASTIYPQELEDYGAAFYDGFKPHFLHPLTLDEVRDVLVHLAQAGEQPGLVDRIHQERPRLAALRDLTGGNPRTAVMLFELFAHGFSEDAFEDLESLLDLMTPLYQSRLDQLSDLAQTIVGTLAQELASADQGGDRQPGAARGQQRAAAARPLAGHRPGRGDRGLSEQENRISDRRAVLQHLVSDAFHEPPAAGQPGLPDAVPGRVPHAG